MTVAARATTGNMPLPALLGSCAAAWPTVLVRGVQLDSRRVRPGDLFLAVAGDSQDGRQFIEQAIASGAVAVAAEPPVAGFVDAVQVPLLEIPELAREAGVIAARFYGDPSLELDMVAITGTNGKTTTTRLLAQLLRTQGRRCGVIGTLGAVLDDSVAAAINTTPDAVALQQQLAAWRDDGVAAVSMEVSSHALDQGRVNGARFDIAVFTNLSRDHLDYHGSMAAYGRSKQQLFHSPGLRHAVVNLDDAYGAELLAGLPATVQAWTFSAAGLGAARIRVTEAQFHPGGVRANLETPWGSGTFASPLPGDFNLANVLAAVTCALLLEHELSSVLAAVAGLQPVPGRMEPVPNGAGLQVIVDYAHTPDALAQVLAALRPHVAGQLVVVFGCGGDRDPGKRGPMGHIACDAADRVILTSDNPRHEDPQRILQDIQSGCRGEVQIEPDRAAAIAAAIAGASAGDCVLIAGKGHEDYQIIGSERRPFSDADVAARALQGRVSA
ncbi:UDP-N-acetylmuramoyl-L-alanyl-D-glutamate--2,6-diaminopimelate ligase [Haliea sp. E1-2-M8]|uniref:UDP-N-acetylmuramoyl-L-alanyl-D-glutamate--2, 6-diaminopimelate ligase n=1 Tax=Haliea sp. E1-2-M8 TaxID=3064706 RepID=UPI00271B2B1A|nr:UDP-N-acetylmuramoyl-L-alanyl-D-glutamate--2,6-diaminopimelate ligase [Haliea sp. E1-2-M8]MDO8861391.1 UDP-N-acetylmuramoyl-L-alanyl-D-glutamate--2,6-diaminopimelate ligase [Haliea sp. E1-2-M8]